MHMKTLIKLIEKKIGGDNRLEWFGTTGTNVKRTKRKKGTILKHDIQKPKLRYIIPLSNEI